MAKIRVAIVGLGGMGRRWAKVAGTYHGSCLNLIIDADKIKSQEAEKHWKCNFDSDLKALASPEIDAVVVATPNVFLAPITKLALQNGKHVLCEKPAGVNSKEIKSNIDVSRKNKLTYMIGFNHRFHPALARAKQLVSSGAIGRIHFIRGVYGHGGRPGYENEWRNKPELAGGGELLDQGVHLLDLASWFLSPQYPYYKKISGILSNNFWSQTLEDNAFLTLQNYSGTTVSLHISSTQWQKKFLWEIYGETGFIAVEGLGGNYGIESLSYRKRCPLSEKLGRENKISFPPKKGFEDPDISLFSLWQRFIGSIKSGIANYGMEFEPAGSDALDALRIIEKLYRQEGRIK